MSDQQENPDTGSVSSSESCEQAQPTPGPWQIATSCSYRRIVNDRMSPVCVPTVQSADGHPDLYFPNGGVNGPDARLIAAAPDMLKALKLCKHQIQEIASQAGHDPGVYKAYTMVEDALASAEGSEE